MAQDLICKLLPNSWQLLFLVVNQPPVKGFSCAELSLIVNKGTWISAVLVCRSKDPFAVMQDAIA